MYFVRNRLNIRIVFCFVGFISRKMEGIKIAIYSEVWFTGENEMDFFMDGVIYGELNVWNANQGSKNGCGVVADVVFQ